MQNTRQLVETIQGTGTLEVRGVAEPVNYIILRYQDYVGSAPTTSDASGKVSSASKVVVQDAYNTRGYLKLTLADGRVANITVTNLRGEFVVSSEIA